MTYTKDNLKTLFRSRFDLSKWQKFLVDYFKSKEILHNPEQLEESASEYEGYYLGETNSSDNYRIGFFYYRMTDGSVARRKVGLRNLVRPYLNYGIDVALAVFEDGENWRLSLVCNLKGEDEATTAKRFTYVFGDPRATYATPVKRFLDLQKCADKYQDIREAFSVEALSDDFFTEYRKQYAKFVRFITGKEYVKSGNKWVEKDVCQPDAQFEDSFGGNKKLVRDYIKKMMGRIVFLYFLQSKGWLAGNYHYMHDLFHTATDDVRDNYLDFVLEPMFFGLLNTKPEDRATAPLVNGVGVKYVADADRIPYLNGGLFQQEDVDRVNSKFPAEMFESLFDFFDSYNFTIDENDPDDAEVGVDPEMLGKIFENLLEDNKDKGAFYTPKEIVRYMCQESLVAYLQTGEDEEAVRESIARFVHSYDVESIGGAESELASRIDQRLKDVKICDPAIGSGAFPMGLLRELYNCRKAIEIFDADNAADIKRHIIQNNIYGVDIEHGAVDIARLRFWLALVIDEKEPMPLPNLDFKIMQGNSLLESFHGVDLSQMHKSVRVEKSSKKTRGMLAISFEETDVLDTIQRLVKSYFDITDHAQREVCRQQINTYIKDYMMKCADGNEKVQEAIKELEFPNSQFFLWHTYFADVFEKGGFDIVIGNPPYIDSEAMCKKMPELRNIYSSKFSSARGNWDLFVVFIELGILLTNNNGIYSFIVPNKLIAAKYANVLRDKIKENCIIEIRDYGDVDVFINACVYPCTIIVSKNNGMNNPLFVKMRNIETKEACNTISFNTFQDIKFWDVGFVETNRFDVIDKYLSFPTMKTMPFVKILGAATVAEAYYIREKVYDSIESPNSFKMVNTGTIDPYIGFWGISPMQYLKGKFMFPRVNKEDVKSMNIKRYTQSSCSKLIVAGMSKRIEALWDNGDYLAGKSTTLITADSDDVLFFILGVLNSKLTSVCINIIFNSIKMSGGFLNIGVRELECMTIPKSDEEIAFIAKEITMRKRVDSNADTSALENKIDNIVYHLYGLTYDEVLVVDPATPISREEYLAYKETNAKC